MLPTTVHTNDNLILAFVISELVAQNGPLKDSTGAVMTQAAIDAFMRAGVVRLRAGNANQQETDFLNLLVPIFNNYLAP